MVPAGPPEAAGDPQVEEVIVGGGEEGGEEMGGNTGFQTKALMAGDGTARRTLLRLLRRG